MIGRANSAIDAGRKLEGHVNVAFLDLTVWNMATTSKSNPNFEDKGKMIKLGGQNDFETSEEEESPFKFQALEVFLQATEAISFCAEVSKYEAVEKSLRDEMDVVKECNVILEKEWNALDVKVTDLEALAKGKGRELIDLNSLLTFVKSQNDVLVDQVHKLEVSSSGLQEKVTVCENCMEQLERFQDDRMKTVNDKFDQLYTDFVEMALHLEEKFYHHLLTTISERRWLLTQGVELAVVKSLNSLEYLSVLGATISKAIEKGMQDGLSAGITHGREGRVLIDVAAYNPSAEADYTSALQMLQSVNFSLLADLRSNKDASVETVMNILHLEEPLAERLGLTELQPSVDQLTVPIYHLPDRVVVGATALSLALDVSSIRVWKTRENIANQRSPFRDVFIPLGVPFSTTALTGMEGASSVSMFVVANTTTALSTTLASASTIPPITIEDYEVMGTEEAQGNGQVRFLLFPTQVLAGHPPSAGLTISLIHMD
nr:magnesium transporter MRS2-I [Tanacetum cinerariifolium]